MATDTKEPTNGDDAGADADADADAEADTETNTSDASGEATSSEPAQPALELAAPVGNDRSSVWAPSSQPKTLIGKQMYEYQLAALTWMRSIEEHAAKGFPFGASFDDCSLLDQLEIDQRRFSDRLFARGGILGDEMGLGKTVTMISLILSNRKPKVPRPEVSLPRRQALYESSQTLVLCPSHLVQQWEAEIRACSALRPCVIATVADWEALSYEDILTHHDVVIVSHAFLRNQSYSAACGNLAHIHDFGDAAAKGIDPTTVVRRSRRGKAEDEKPRIKGLSRDDKAPLLQRIGWHRIILDEGHELLSAAREPITPAAKILQSFLATYRWLVSGTPVPHKTDSLLGIMDFLQVSTGKYEFEEAHWSWRKIVFDTVRENLFWRNTKETAEAGRYIPPVVEEVIFLTHTQVERALYLAAEQAGTMVVR